MLKIYKLVTLVMCSILLVFMISGCSNSNDTDKENNNTDNSETDIGFNLEDGEGMAVLPDGYYYDSEGKLIDPDGNEVTDISTVPFIEASSGNIGDSWKTLTGDTAIIDTGNIVRYETVKGSNAIEIGYLIYENDDISIYMNNFVRGGDGAMKNVLNESNSGTMVLSIRNNTDKNLDVNLNGLNINNVANQLQAIAHLIPGDCYMQFPWYTDNESTEVSPITKASISLTITDGNEYEVKTGILDITDDINNICRVVKADSDNIVEASDSADENTESVNNTETTESDVQVTEEKSENADKAGSDTKTDNDNTTAEKADNTSKPE